MRDCFRQSPSKLVCWLSGRGGAANGQHTLPKSGRGSLLRSDQIPAQIPANDHLVPIFWATERRLIVRHQTKTISALYIQPYVCQIQCMLCYSSVLY